MMDQPKATISPNELASYLRSPTLFMWKILGTKPTPYQAQILEDEHKRLIIVGGRQIGKSTMLAAKALWRAFVSKQLILIVSIGQRQSDLIYTTVRTYIEGNQLLASRVKKMTRTEIQFDNGSSIHSLPSGKTGATIRGYSATMVLFDEAAFIPDEVFVAVEPALAVRGEQVIYSSTPYGKTGYFYKLYDAQKTTPPRDRSPVYVIPSVESIPYGIVTQKYLDEQRMVFTAAQYASEYEATFIDEAGLYYPISLLMQNVHDYEYKLPTESDSGTFLLGLDIARSGSDETGIVLVRENDKKDRKVQWVMTLAKMNIPEVVGYVSNLIKQINVSRVYVDQSGLGAGAVDLLKQSFGGIIYGVDFTEKNRENMYGNLKLYLEQKRIVLNRSDTKMLYQFSSYAAKYDVNGKLRLQKDTALHDDLTDALALTFVDLVRSRMFVLEEGMDLRRGASVANDMRPFTQPRHTFSPLDWGGKK